MLKAVIFDFDGVIVDSEALHLRAFNRVLSRFGVEIATEDYYAEYLGLTDLECFQVVSQQRQLSLDEQGIEGLIRQKTQVFEELAGAGGRIIEGVPDFLQMLKDNDIAMAICSGALRAEIELILKQARLRHFFVEIVSAEQVRRGKPDPEGFLLSLQELNRDRGSAVTAGQCVVIEDSRWGLAAARAAGMHAVGVTNSYDADELSRCGGAEKVVAHLSELSIENLQRLCV